MHSNRELHAIQFSTLLYLETHFGHQAFYLPVIEFNLGYFTWVLS